MFSINDKESQKEKKNGKKFIEGKRSYPPSPSGRASILGHSPLKVRPIRILYQIGRNFDIRTNNQLQRDRYYL